MTHRSTLRFGLTLLSLLWIGCRLPMQQNGAGDGGFDSDAFSNGAGPDGSQGIDSIGVVNDAGSGGSDSTPPPVGVIGMPCSMDSDCAGGTIAFCGSPSLDLTFSMNGYCTANCSSNADCPSDSKCAALLSGTLCLKRCQSNSDCRTSDGYSCHDGTCGILANLMAGLPSGTVGTACTGGAMTPVQGSCGQGELCFADAQGFS